MVATRDLAKLYQVETKRINEAVKNNSERFMFQLSKLEYDNLRSQLGTAVYNSMSRTLPHVFTEQGVAMLATVLRTSVAEEVSIAIIDAFVEMKKYISTNLIEQKYINNLVFEHDGDIKLIKESLIKLNNNENNTGLFFEGQIYDVYSLLLDILGQANNNIIIIDNYIDKNILDVSRKIDKDVLVITNKYNNEDYIKYKEQYKNIKLKINNKIHDRFIIIDNETLYHCGYSFKDLGKKCFAITKIENREWLERILGSKILRVK